MKLTVYSIPLTIPTKLYIPLLIATLAGAGSTARGQAVRYCDSTWSDAVKSVQLCRDGIEQEKPTLTLDNDGTSGERLSLSFDLLEEQPQDLRYRFIHCDRAWHADELEPHEYYNGFEEQRIDDYRSSFTTLQPYIHYHTVFPTEYSRFTLSGNYVVAVYRYDAPDSILLTRRFYVNENLLDMTLTVERAASGGALHNDQEVSLTIEGLRRDAIGAQMMLRPEYLHPWVQQNGRIDNMRELPFSGYAAGKLCYRWADANRFAGGNNYRYFDISNLRAPIYNVHRIERYGGETHVILRPEENRSRKAFMTEEGLNGGMKIHVWDRNDATVEADYAWVHFTLPMDRPVLDGSIHIVGALTEWSLDDASRMEWNSEFRTYTCRLFLKQGYYAYQLLFLPTGGDEGHTALLEGDHSETPNRYHVYVYARLPGERYDRLIGVR